VYSSFCQYHVLRSIIIVYDGLCVEQKKSWNAGESYQLRFSVICLSHSYAFVVIFELQISLLGLVTFPAPYLPWVLLGFSALVGHDVTNDGLGIAVGHLYYYAEEVWPALAAARGWRIRRLLPIPYPLHFLFGTIEAARRRYYDDPHQDANAEPQNPVINNVVM
jgi:Der1-like family